MTPGKGGSLDGAFRDLYRWYKVHHRALPWRRTRDPWAIWVSEVMLQQTRVETVLGYFETFLARFPDPARLAEASTEEALKAWEGLGYYARVRHLRDAARRVVAQHGGQVPADARALAALPGIGRSTAGAIASLAFGLPEPVLDANVRRVAVRLLDLREDPSSPAAGRRLWETVTAWVRASPDPALHNQALMEIGALRCLPGRPLCAGCPLAEACLARRHGTAADLPVQRPRRPIPTVQAAVGILRDDSGRVFLQRRPLQGLLGGLWEFPGGKREGVESFEQTLVREVQEETGLAVLRPRFLGTVRHAYTHFRVVLQVFEARVSGDRPSAPRGQRETRWLYPEEVSGLALPEATRRILQRFLRRPLPGEEGDDGVPPRNDRKPRIAARPVQDQAKRSPKRA